MSKAPGELYIEQVHPSLSLPEARVRCAVSTVLEGEGRPRGNLGIILGTHDLIRSLNEQFLGRSYLTDVLAFPLGEDPDRVEGEVYVDLDTARERAPEFGASFEEEALRYIIHGVLHLAGYRDDTPEGKARMHALEDTYLAAMRTRGCL